MSRRFQFSLRTLLMAVTIAAISSWLLRWHANRLEVLADSFQALIHQKRYAEAEAVSAKAHHLYPNEQAAIMMEITCRIFIRRERLPEPEPALDIDITAWQRLVDEHRARKAANAIRPMSDSQE
jgi:hypothetical protein